MSLYRTRHIATDKNIGYFLYYYVMLCFAQKEDRPQENTMPEQNSVNGKHLGGSLASRGDLGGIIWEALWHLGVTREACRRHLEQQKMSRSAGDHQVRYLRTTFLKKPIIAESGEGDPHKVSIFTTT